MFTERGARQAVEAVVSRLAGLGIRLVHLADAIGAATACLIRATVAAARDCADVEIGLHLHNTYGAASANVGETLNLGIRRFDAALGGIGGCPFAPGASGNLATDDLVHLLHREGIVTGIDVQKLAVLRDEVGIAVGHRLGSALAAVPAVPWAFHGSAL